MSDRFEEMHNHNHPKDQKLFFISEQEATFFTINCESLPNKAPCPRPLPQFEAYSPFGDMRILTSYHGLVCLGIRQCNDRRYSDIILWNPLTTEYKVLSKPSNNPDHMECYSYGAGHGLYYSSCEDDYKLLVVTESGNVYIYSLKSDSWRKLNKKLPFHHGYWGPGFFLNENLYFLDMFEEGSIRFDTTTERFHNIKTPPFFNYKNKPYSTAITVHKGSIHLCVKCNIWRARFLKSTCIALWKFNADADIWNKVVTYQLMPNDNICCLYPKHLMSNGNWLMQNRDGICQVDLKKKYTKDKDDHKSKGKITSKGNYYDQYKLLYYTDSRGISPQDVRYTETFVSPNQYIK